MKNASLWLLVGSSAIGTLLVAQQATMAAKHYIVTPSQIKWTDPPAGVARGTPSVEPGGHLRYAPIEGDPLKPGVLFTIRLRCSDGYKSAPHWHPRDENIVVLKGIFSLGTGDRFDMERMQDIPTGGYGFVPGRMNHFAVCKGETEILVYGIGPRLNNWVSASSAGTPGAGTKPVAR